ncbi:hypothetical protein [Nocardiopsis sp. CNT312]|uniref:hypothetical protein n=1 Tax=Nocardiopsis sp. CNT312 TaxID=1137268 RepID=UPI0004909981|nr:hypothetical protein [Nocardiopsis sp. CNT312]
MTDRDLLRALRSSRTSAGDAYTYLLDAYGEELYRSCILALRDRDAAHVALRDTLIVARAHIRHVPDACHLREWLHVLAEAECARRAVRGSGSGPQWRMPEHVEFVRSRVIDGMAGPGLDAYRAHVSARADHFGRDGFPLPAAARPLARGLVALLPVLAVLLCLLLAVLVADCLLGGGWGTARGPAVDAVR